MLNRDDAIIDFIAKNPGWKRSDICHELAKRFGTTYWNISNGVVLLKRKGLIEMKGQKNKPTYFVACLNKRCLVLPISLEFATRRDAIRAWNLRGEDDGSNPIIPVGRKLEIVRT